MNLWNFVHHYKPLQTYLLTLRSIQERNRWRERVPSEGTGESCAIGGFSLPHGVVYLTSHMNAFSHSNSSWKAIDGLQKNILNTQCVCACAWECVCVCLISVWVWCFRQTIHVLLQKIDFIETHWPWYHIIFRATHWCCAVALLICVVRPAFSSQNHRPVLGRRSNQGRFWMTRSISCLLSVSWLKGPLLPFDRRAADKRLSGASAYLPASFNLLWAAGVEAAACHCPGMWTHNLFNFTQRFKALPPWRPHVPDKGAICFLCPLSIRQERKHCIL